MGKVLIKKNHSYHEKYRALMITAAINITFIDLKVQL